MNEFNWISCLIICYALQSSQHLKWCFQGGKWITGEIVTFTKENCKGKTNWFSSSDRKFSCFNSFVQQISLSDCDLARKYLFMNDFCPLIRPMLREMEEPDSKDRRPSKVGWEYRVSVEIATVENSSLVCFPLLWSFGQLCFSEQI